MKVWVVLMQARDIDGDNWCNSCLFNSVYDGMELLKKKYETVKEGFEELFGEDFEMWWGHDLMRFYAVNDDTRTFTEYWLFEQEVM